MPKYKINDDIRNSINNFLEPVFSTKELLDSGRDLTEDEINKLLSVLGNFPAYNVYEIIDSIRSGVNVIDDECKE